jgi:uncharacterized protein YgiM (DUF1202 family)
MIELFVIAFIHCTGRSCVIFYPRPGQVYISYADCKAQLPEAPSKMTFDAATFQGAEIACLEVPVRDALKDWVALASSNLRDSPSASAKIIGTVKRGTTFRVVAQERKWLRIRTEDGTVGFMWADRAKQIR